MFSELLCTLTPLTMFSAIISTNNPFCNGEKGISLSSGSHFPHGIGAGAISRLPAVRNRREGLGLFFPGQLTWEYSRTWENTPRVGISQLGLYDSLEFQGGPI